jgi:hypothetical protein
MALLLSLCSRSSKGWDSEGKGQSQSKYREEGFHTVFSLRHRTPRELDLGACAENEREAVRHKVNIRPKAYTTLSHGLFLAAAVHT